MEQYISTDSCSQCSDSIIQSTNIWWWISIRIRWCYRKQKILTRRSTTSIQSISWSIQQICYLRLATFLGISRYNSSFWNCRNSKGKNIYRIWFTIRNQWCSGSSIIQSTRYYHRHQTIWCSHRKLYYSIHRNRKSIHC